MTIPIDFVPGSHGNFLEITLNKYLFYNNMNPLQPSDKLIKKLFSKSQEVIDYFKENLPPILVESLDLENIQFGKEIFIGLEWDES